MAEINMRTTCPKCNNERAISDAQARKWLTCEVCGHRYRAAGKNLQKDLRTDDDHALYERLRLDPPKGSTAVRFVLLVIGTFVLFCIFIGGLVGVYSAWLSTFRGFPVRRR